MLIYVCGDLLSINKYYTILNNTYLSKLKKKRTEVYSLIGNLFSFFGELKTIGTDELNKNCEDLANVYPKDL